eukprot:gene33716-40791_t
MKRALESGQGPDKHGVVLNQRYPIRLGESDSAKRSFTLKFGFKPANIDCTAGGALTCHQASDTHEGKVELRTTNDDGKEVIFRGNPLASVGSSSQNHEFVLSFDSDGHFVLCPVHQAIVNLRPKLDALKDGGLGKKDVIDVRSAVTQRGAKKGAHGKRITLPQQEFIVENVSAERRKNSGLMKSE